MHLAVRPYLTTGVAIVGASVIAVAPITPTPPDVQIPNPSVQLAALSNPFAPYVTVFEEAAANAEALLALATDPPPSALPAPALEDLLGSILDDPGASLEGFLASFEGFVAALEAAGGSAPQLIEAVAGNLAAGNVEGAVNTLIFAAVATLLPLATSLLVPLVLPLAPDDLPPAQRQAFAQGLVTGVILGLAGPLISGPGAAGTAIQGVINALDSGEPENILGAFIAGPATVADGVLNGGYGPNLAPFVPVGPVPPGFVPNVLAGGILSPGSAVVTPPSPPSPGQLTVNLPGPIATLIVLGQLLQGVLAPEPEPKTMSVTAVPEPEARLVSLDVTPEPAAAVTTPAASESGAALVGTQSTPAVTPAEDDDEPDKSDDTTIVPDTDTSSGGASPRKAVGDQIRTSVKKFGDAVRKATGRGGRGGGEAGDGDGEAGDGGGEASDGS